MTCQIYEGDGLYIRSTVTIDHNQSDLLTDGDIVKQLLGHIAVGAKEHCEKKVRAGESLGFAGSLMPNNISLFIQECAASCVTKFIAKRRGNGQWDIENNMYIKAALRTRVMADLKYEEFVQAADLSANPYRYKGKVVAVYTMFGRMLSENEGLFSQFGLLVAKGVPSSMFKGQEMVILTIRVIGNTDDKTAVLAEYVGAYKCVQNNCLEYFDGVN